MEITDSLGKELVVGNRVAWNSRGAGGKRGKMFRTGEIKKITIDKQHIKFLVKPDPPCYSFVSLLNKSILKYE